MRFARELDNLVCQRGGSGTIVSDNGMELTSNAILGRDTGGGWHYIAQGIPQQNRWEGILRLERLAPGGLCRSGHGV